MTPPDSDVGRRQVLLNGGLLAAGLVTGAVEQGVREAASALLPSVRVIDGRLATREEELEWIRKAIADHGFSPRDLFPNFLDYADRGLGTPPMPVSSVDQRVEWMLAALQNDPEVRAYVFHRLLALYSPLTLADIQQMARAIGWKTTDNPQFLGPWEHHALAISEAGKP